MLNKSLLVCAIACALAGMSDARMVHAKRLSPAHALVARQVTIQSPTAGPSTSIDDGLNPATASQSQDDGGLLDSIIGGLDPTSSSSSSVTSSSSSSSTTSSLSSSPASISSTSRASSAPSKSFTSTSVDVVNITSTASNDPAPTPSQSQSSQNQQDDTKSSGVGKKTLIIIVAVASSVGLIAAIWTLLRKWKFSPSRKFNDRLNPIDWKSDLDADGDAKMLMRTSSNGSNAASLNRHNSFGSTAGSARGAMSERGAVRTAIHGQPARSNVAATYGNGAMPAFPPGFVPHAQQQFQAPTPYEQVSRQAAVVHGGNNFARY